MTQTVAIEGVDHIGIRVRDVDRALAFYRVLGFTLVHRAVGDDVAMALSSLRFGHQEGLHPIHRSQGFPTVDLDLISRCGCLS